MAFRTLTSRTGIDNKLKRVVIVRLTGLSTSIVARLVRLDTGRLYRFDIVEIAAALLSF